MLCASRILLIIVVLSHRRPMYLTRTDRPCYKVRQRYIIFATHQSFHFSLTFFQFDSQYFSARRTFSMRRRSTSFFLLKFHRQRKTRRFFSAQDKRREKPFYKMMMIIVVIIMREREIVFHVPPILSLDIGTFSTPCVLSYAPIFRTAIF